MADEVEGPEMEIHSSELIEHLRFLKVVREAKALEFEMTVEM